jgi:hypothetical protein
MSSTAPHTTKHRHLTPAEQLQPDVVGHLVEAVEEDRDPPVLEQLTAELATTTTTQQRDLGELVAESLSDRGGDRIPVKSRSSATHQMVR